MRRLLFLLLPALLLGGCGAKVDRFELEPATVGGGRVLLGIGDQHTAMFRDRRFAELGVTYTRYSTAWNAIFTEPAVLDEWLQAARAAGQRPLVSFNRARGSECPADPCELPSLPDYTRAVRAFVARYPWVHDVQPWNEVNSSTQPTAGHPEAAARFYLALREACPRCTIPAADLLAGSDVESWLARFMRVAGRPRLWGLHNYSDVNRFTDAGTRQYLSLVPGEVWITETGGLVSFSPRAGEVRFAPDEARAGRATGQAVRLAGLDPRITRLYLYQWQILDLADRFDAGLVRPDGSERPGLTALRGLIDRRW